MVYKEIYPQALTLMTDVFGNYVVQKVYILIFPIINTDFFSILLFTWNTIYQLHNLMSHTLTYYFCVFSSLSMEWHHR